MKINAEKTQYEGMLTTAEFDQVVDNFKYMCKCAFEVVAPVIVAWVAIFCIAKCVLSFS